MTRWAWAAVGLGGAWLVIAWLQRVLRKLRQDLAPHGTLPSQWLEDQIRNRR